MLKRSNKRDTSVTLRRASAKGTSASCTSNRDARIARLYMTPQKRDQIEYRPTSYNSSNADVHCGSRANALQASSPCQTALSVPLTWHSQLVALAMMTNSKNHSLL